MYQRLPRNDGLFLMKTFLAGLKSFFLYVASPSYARQLNHDAADAEAVTKTLNGDFCDVACDHESRGPVVHLFDKEWALPHLRRWGYIE